MVDLDGKIVDGRCDAQRLARAKYVDPGGLAENFSARPRLLAGA